MEAPEELPKKTKLFFAHAADNWDAEFYAKVNDDVYVNIGEYQQNEYYILCQSLKCRFQCGRVLLRTL